MGFLVFIFILFALTKRDMRKSDLFKGLFGVSIGITVLLSLLTASGFSGIFGLLVFVAVLMYLTGRGRTDEQKQNRDNAAYRSTRQQDGRYYSSRGDGKAMNGKAYQQWQANVNESWQRYQQQFGQGGAAGSGGAAGQAGQPGAYGQTGTYQTGSYTRPQASAQPGTPAGTAAKSNRRVTSYILPRSTKKRTRILDAFNKKYHLSLSDEEIKRIVDSSYISDSWKTELEAMSEKYDNVYQWFTGPTSWLRIYLYVFELQTISSDFERQEHIVQDTFDEVFRYAATLTSLTMEERIRRVNDRFFTYFDETSFMIAYRYMEAQGRAYDFADNVDVVTNESELDALARKYDQMPSPAAQAHTAADEEEEGEGQFMQQEG